MRRISLLSGLLFTSVLSIGQDAKEILQKCYEKCQSIKNGYFEMSQYEKPLNEKDTSLNIYHCYFKKLDHDKIYSSAFHYQRFYNGKYTGDVIYTGNEYVYCLTEDSTGVVLSKSKWAKKIKSDSDGTLYSPLTGSQSEPLPHGSMFKYSNMAIKLIGEETINNEVCYHIQINHVSEKNNRKEAIYLLRHEFQFWISKDDFLPVQYSEAIDLTMINDTMYQFNKFILTKSEFNNLTDESYLTLSSAPSFYKIKDYVPFKAPPLLPNDTIAPDWTLLSLQDENRSLHEFSGDLVLVDFFFKNCPPCIKALPDLQSLHEQFIDKGLKVVGIDPYDSKEDDIALFLAKFDVTYTVLLGGKSVAKDYRVSSYPTIYIIDQNRRIIYSKVGYSENSKASLETIIKMNLD